MKHKIAVITSALFMALTMTACGSGGSGTYSAIGSYLPNAQVLDGMAIQGKTAQEFSSDTQQSVRDWLDGLGS